MGEVIDDNLTRRTWQLLQPGEIELDGLILKTNLSGSEEAEMHAVTVEVGDVIAENAGFDPSDTYVYSGTDDPDFASNQHQGLTLEDESFVWECQQLLRDGSFDVVFYFEASADSDGIVETLESSGHEVIAIEGSADSPDNAVIESDR